MRLIAILGLSVLAGCGQLAQSRPGAGFMQSILVGEPGDQVESTLTNASINRAFIEAQANDLMLVSVISREATAVVVRAGHNGSASTWISPDGIGITFDEGVLIATRGLGNDLMGADVEGVKQGFRGVRNYLRTNSYLNGLGQIEIAEYRCSMTFEKTDSITIYEMIYQTNVYVETCSGAGESFENRYWSAANGVIWQARQWISADIGYLGYQRL